MKTGVLLEIGAYSDVAGLKPVRHAWRVTASPAAELFLIGSECFGVSKNARTEIARLQIAGEYTKSCHVTAPCVQHHGTQVAQRKMFRQHRDVVTAPFTQALMTAQPTTQSEVLTSPKASPAPLHRAWPGVHRKVSFTGVSASKVPLIASFEPHAVAPGRRFYRSHSHWREDLRKNPCPFRPASKR